MSTPYGGDEVNAVVIDVGSQACKAGFGGEDTPKAVFPSCVGHIPGREGAADAGAGAANGSNGAVKKRKREDLYVGTAALNIRTDNMEVIPGLKDGLYADMDHIAALWQHALKDRLKIEPGEHPMLLAEPTFNTKALREATVSLMFEEFGAPAVFLAKNAVLSSFATGKQTSLSVDIGHEATVVAAVHDGYVLNKTIQRAPLAGRLLTQCLLRSIQTGDRPSAIRPRYAFVRKEIVPGAFEVQDIPTPNTPASFHNFQVEQIAGDIKETVCRVNDVPFDETENSHIPNVTYELPDGNELQIGVDRFKVPEVLFRPALVSTFPGLEDVRSYDGTPLLSLQELVNSSIVKCDIDQRREMYNSLVLTGGTSLFTQAKDRLERELGELAVGTKVKVLCPANPVERKFSVWIGGSILASLGSFQQMWMSKAEYDEHGPALMHRKSP